MTDSDTYTQVEGYSEVVESSEASSTSSSSEVKSIIKDILESSSSSSGSDASSSTSSNDPSKPNADIKTKTDVNGDKETTYVADYSTEDIKAITEAFGKWLYQSDYAKDAVLVQSDFDSITKVSDGSPTFLSFKAPKEKVATKRLPYLLISSMRMAMNILLVFRVVSSMVRKSQTMISRTIKTRLIPLL